MSRITVSAVGGAMHKIDWEIRVAHASKIFRRTPPLAAFTLTSNHHGGNSSDWLSEKEVSKATGLLDK
jgi:hypothetical protein